jgi:uncharacterized protein
MAWKLDDRLVAAALLFVSNSFMTLAWYGHLRFKHASLWMVIVVSWGIAFFEYCFQVPANRIGYRAATPYQLKIMQEAITLVVFMIFASIYFDEGPKAKYMVSFGLVFAAVAVAFS